MDPLRKRSVSAHSRSTLSAADFTVVTWMTCCKPNANLGKSAGTIKNNRKRSERYQPRLSALANVSATLIYRSACDRSAFIGRRCPRTSDDRYRSRPWKTDSQGRRHCFDHNAYLAFVIHMFIL